MSNVKGTTRVSNNDRKLMKDLWVAGKDNPVEKNRLKRKLTQTEKATRQSMPEERAELAFKNLRKRQKTTLPHIEPQDSDDALALQCVQSATWADFCHRQRAMSDDAETLVEFQALLRNRKKKSKESIKTTTPTAAAAAAATLAAQHQVIMRWLTGKPNESTTTTSFHFIGNVKNKRFNNFRIKSEAHRNKTSKICTDVTLKQLPEHFFSIIDFQPYEYRFTNVAKENNYTQLTSASDFDANCATRLADCHAQGLVMRLKQSTVAAPVRAVTGGAAGMTTSSKKRVELLFSNAYESVRLPRIMVRCDYCSELVPSSNIVPQAHRLFFHPHCCKPATGAATTGAAAAFQFAVFQN